MHFSSWPNQVERFFALITCKAISRGLSPMLSDSSGKFDHFVTSYSATCSLFRWTAMADEPLEKLHRLCSPTTASWLSMIL